MLPHRVGVVVQNLQGCIRHKKINSASCQPKLPHPRGTHRQPRNIQKMRHTATRQGHAPAPMQHGLPLLGHWPGRPGHFVANGGFKIGFGMAPAIAALMAELVLLDRDRIPDAFRLT